MSFVAAPRPATAPVPVACPFCTSAQVSTTDKNTDSAYWRCQACGQIWNPARLITVPSWR